MRKRDLVRSTLCTHLPGSGTGLWEAGLRAQIRGQRDKSGSCCTHPKETVSPPQASPNRTVCTFAQAGYLCFPPEAPAHIQRGKKQNKTGKRPRINETKLRCVSIPEEINPEYSLEGLMLKLKLQYFSHLMQRADSLEKTWMLRKIEG